IDPAGLLLGGHRGDVRCAFLLLRLLLLRLLLNDQLLSQARDSPEPEHHCRDQPPHASVLLARKGGKQWPPSRSPDLWIVAWAQPSHPHGGQWLRVERNGHAPHTQWRDRAGLPER